MAGGDFGCCIFVAANKKVLGCRGFHKVTSFRASRSGIGCRLEKCRAQRA